MADVMRRLGTLKFSLRRAVSNTAINTASKAALKATLTASGHPLKARVQV